MNTQALIDAVVQRTTVFIAQLATAGGLRIPLGGVANQVFLELTKELENQGVRKKVIADMFGMALRTYHRKVHDLRVSRTETGRTLWEVVFAFVREREPVSGREIQRRFGGDDPEILSGVLNDLTGSGLVYRAGNGDGAVYRVADQADFVELDEERRREANQYLVWLAVYRNHPIDLGRLVELSGVPRAACEQALDALLSTGRIRATRRGEQTEYECQELQIPLGTSQGWEAAVLDHFQAMVAAVGAKLSLGASRSDLRDVVGGSTWSLDVWESHPLAEEALMTLRRVRTEIEDLRQRVDAFNRTHPRRGAKQRVVCYAGQYVVREGAATESSSGWDEE